MKICYPEVRDPFQLGQRYVSDRVPDLDFHIKNNIDYEAIGLNLQNDQNGVFTDSGYIFEDKSVKQYDIQGVWRRNRLISDLKSLTQFSFHAISRNILMLI